MLVREVPYVAMYPFHVGGFGPRRHGREIDAVDAAIWEEVAEETAFDAGAAADFDDLSGSGDWGVNYIAVHHLDEAGGLVFETSLFVCTGNVSEVAVGGTVRTHSFGSGYSSFVSWYVGFRALGSVSLDMAQCFNLVR